MTENMTSMDKAVINRMKEIMSLPDTALTATALEVLKNACPDDVGLDECGANEECSNCTKCWLTALDLKETTMCGL